MTGWHKSGKLIELEKKWLGRETPWAVEMRDKTQ